MTDSVAQRIESLSAQLEGLEAAAAGLETDPGTGVSVRRIARALERTAGGLGLTEIAAGAEAIQRAADAHLGRSVTNFLHRVRELRHVAAVEPSTILIVEDNKTVAAATRAYLKGPGRELILVETAADALRVLASREVHVVILDLILPDRDGRDVLVEMRERAGTATIPVVVLSSKGGGVARAECLAVGADEFIEKPAEPGTLRAAVSRQIAAGKRRRDALRDGTTGLPNRAGISVEYEERRRAAHRDGIPLSIAVLALDTLAEITMKLGRDAGDQFLLEVCSAMRAAIGEGDCLGRWETTVLVGIFPGRTEESAKQLIETTILALARATSLDGFRQAGIAVSLSGGVTGVAADEPLHDVIASAERSLYSAQASEETSVRSGSDPLDFEMRTVLLVEDDRVTATLIHHRLVRDGHEVVGFGDGSEAHSWALKNDFDLAILDVKVPGMDGFELLAKLRAVARYEDVPIVMLTGMGSEADVIRGLELGADDYVLKPFSPSELLARVRRLLHARGASATPTGSPHEARA